jgi:hypothetical protein
MRKEKPHAVKNLNEDIKRAIIFINGLASKGVENNLVQFAREELGSIVNIPRHGNAVKIHESTIGDMVNFKLLYENSSNRLFSLTDTKSQLVINNEYILQRDKIGNHCIIKPIYEEINNSKFIEFNITINEIDNIKDNIINEGLTINSMFNSNDSEYRFIREACLKLFGKYPDNIEIK